MSVLKSVERYGKTSWCPVVGQSNLLASGSLTSSINQHTFDSTASLEIFDINLSTLDENAMQCIGSIDVKDRFSSIGWGKKGSTDGTYSHGIIAGGMTDGSIHLFNAAAIIQRPQTHRTSSPTGGNAVISRVEKHRGDVLCIDWSPLEGNLFASSGADGEVYTWDIAKPAQPAAMTPSDTLKATQTHPAVTALAWNEKLIPILASGTEHGEVIIYDLRARREKVRVRNSARSSTLRTQAIRWSPESPVTFAVCYSQSNVVELWDVRNSLAPKARLGDGIHNLNNNGQEGILSIDWSNIDPTILLSSDADGKIVAWDTHTSTYLTDYTLTPDRPANKHFDLLFHPSVPNIISTSSIEPKVTVASLPHTGLNHVAKWLKRPAGVAFGFGGRLVSFHSTATDDTQKSASQSEASTRPPSPTHKAPQQPPTVSISQLPVDADLLNHSANLQRILGEQRYLEYCIQKAELSSNAEDRSTWRFMMILFEDEKQQKPLLLKELGFEPPVGSEAAHVIEDAKALEKQKALDAQPLPDADDFFNTDDFNATPPFSNDAVTENGVATNASSAGDSVHAPQQNGIGSRLQKSLDLSDSSSFTETEVDRAIKQALVFGDFATAVNKCITQNRMADALVFASFGAGDLWEQTRDLYFNQHKNPFIRNVMKSVVGSNLDEVVANNDVSSWQQTLAVLITYARPDRYAELINLLGTRLEEFNNINGAIVCYMCSYNIDRLIPLWSHRSRDLQDGVEKTTLYAKAVKTRLPIASAYLSGKFSEYAGVLATQGALTDAWNYLCAVADANTASPDDITSAALLDRIFNATNTGYGQQQQAPPFPFAPLQVNIDPKMRNLAGAYEQLKQRKLARSQPPAQQQQQQPQHSHHPSGQQQTPYSQPQQQGYSQTGQQQQYAPQQQQQRPPYGQLAQQPQYNQPPPNQYQQQNQPSPYNPQQQHQPPPQQYAPQQQPPYPAAAGHAPHQYQQHAAPPPMTPRSGMQGPQHPFAPPPQQQQQQPSFNQPPFPSQPQQPPFHQPPPQQHPHPQQQQPPPLTHQPSYSAPQPPLQFPPSQQPSYGQPPPPQQPQNAAMPQTPYQPRAPQQPPQTQPPPPQQQQMPAAFPTHQRAPSQPSFNQPPPTQPHATPAPQPGHTASRHPQANILQPNLAAAATAPPSAVNGRTASTSSLPGTAPSPSSAPVSLTAEQSQQMGALQSVVQRLLSSASLKPVDHKKVVDIQNKLKLLEQKLGSGTLSASAQQILQRLCAAVSSNDWAEAQACHMKLVQSEWAGNDAWLLGLKTLLMLAKRDLSA